MTGFGGEEPQLEVDLREWLSSREGISIRHPTPPTCDFCGQEIEPGTVSSQYASTLDLCQDADQQSLAFQRHYCEVCNRDEITYPCAHAYEVLAEHRVTEEYRLTDIDAVDVSERGEGHGWSPVAVCREVIGRDPEDLRLGGAEGVGPEAVVDTLALYGLSVPVVVAADGATISGEQLAQAQEQMEFVAEELTFKGPEEQTDWIQAQPYPPTGQIVMVVPEEDGR
jgi:hypothetical protein